MTRHCHLNSQLAAINCQRRSSTAAAAAARHGAAVVAAPAQPAAAAAAATLPTCWRRNQTQKRAIAAAGIAPGHEQRNTALAAFNAAPAGTVGAAGDVVAARQVQGRGLRQHFKALVVQSPRRGSQAGAACAAQA